MEFKSTGTELYSTYIHRSRYARWREEDVRRETYQESVDRYLDFFSSIVPDGVSNEFVQAVRGEMLNLGAVGSMRGLATAGRALERDEVAVYNCSYSVIDCIESFDEIMYMLMCGVGCGFSVEKRYTEKLPVVPNTFIDLDEVFVIDDCKMGWVEALRYLITSLYDGKIPAFDFSKIRPEGERLKTFGGRSSGPGPLINLFQFIHKVFEEAAGRKLRPAECADIVCMIADIVKVGGVRRSALICLTDLEDAEMAEYKSGDWWREDRTPYRALANISAVYEDTPSQEVFEKEWQTMYNSYSGERGIFSRSGAINKLNLQGLRDTDFEFGVNPCGEQILRPNQFCNLTEVIVRPEDTLEDFLRKIVVATVLGTVQSSLTSFRWLRPVWAKNTSEERLLGVSLTGVMDHTVLNGSQGEDVLKEWLLKGNEIAHKTNVEWAEKIGINRSLGICTNKPSGTVSQLMNTASGLHPRYAKYYWRTVRNSYKDPLTQFLADRGIPVEPLKTDPSTAVLYFPIAAPEGAITADKFNGLDQYQVWKIYNQYWSDHSVSCTVYYTDDNFAEIGEKVLSDFDIMTGISFLPYDGGIYEQAPYIPITKEEYEEALKTFPKDIDWSELGLYEQEDNTEASQTYACVGGVCEL